jgi:hypothetical protein
MGLPLASGARPADARRRRAHRPLVRHEHGHDDQKRLHRLAEEANRAKDTFLATVSHELRTPLTSMMGWAELLKLGMLDEKGQAHALDVIESSARAQAQLIGDLLDISRIISGKLRLDVQPLELPPIIEAAMDVVRPAAAAKTIQLVARFEPKIGTVSGDPDRLQQVVWNLLSNAVKFTPEGGRVEVVLRRADSQAELVVTDNGAGISPDFLPHVFEHFRQADSTSTRTHGGLGLGWRSCVASSNYTAEPSRPKARAKDEGQPSASVSRCSRNHARRSPAKPGPGRARSQPLELAKSRIANGKRSRKYFRQTLHPSEHRLWIGRQVSTRPLCLCPGYFTGRDLDLERLGTTRRLFPDRFESAAILFKILRHSEGFILLSERSWICGVSTMPVKRAPQKRPRASASRPPSSEYDRKRV